MLHASLKTQFPYLTAANYHVTSPPDAQYNCIAWAAAEDDVWWWPDSMLNYHWPESALRQETIEAFIQAFSTKGFSPCSDGSLETGFEKIALYAINEKPTHAARQLSDGSWASKLGQNHDICHAIDALDGPQYGSVTLFLKRAFE